MARDLVAFLAVSSLIISGMGFFGTYIAYLMLGASPNSTICMIAFFIAFGVYSLDKVVDIGRDAINRPERQSFLNGRRDQIICCSVAAYAMAGLLTFILAPSALPVVFIPIIVNAFYGMRPIPSLPRIKDIPVMKNLAVSAIWTLVVTLLPAIDLGVGLGQVAPISVFILVNMFVGNVLFDIRDIEGDEATGVRTLSVILGARRTSLLLLLINSALWPLLFGLAEQATTLGIWLTLYGYASITYFRKRRGSQSLDLFVDGEWMLAVIALTALGMI